MAMFDLELDKVIGEVKKRQAKKILLQLPDGMKHRADVVVDEIEKQTGAHCLIWFSSCFGQCDFPLGLGPLGIDLMISYGHNRYNKTAEDW